MDLPRTSRYVLNTLENRLDAKILHVGCGNSRLGRMLHDDGYINVAWSRSWEKGWDDMGQEWGQKLAVTACETPLLVDDYLTISVFKRDLTWFNHQLFKKWTNHGDIGDKSQLNRWFQRRRRPLGDFTKKFMAPFEAVWSREIRLRKRMGT